MIVIIAGTYDEAQRYAAIRGYADSQWVQGLSTDQVRKLDVTSVQLVGTYWRREDWNSLFDYAAYRIGVPAGEDI